MMNDEQNKFQVVVLAKSLGKLVSIASHWWCPQDVMLCENPQSG
jgi:hypothetical protein